MLLLLAVFRVHVPVLGSWKSQLMGSVKGLEMPPWKRSGLIICCFLDVTCRCLETHFSFLSFKVVMALKCGGHIFNNLFTGINTRHIYLTSRMVLYLQLFFCCFFPPFKDVC